MSDERTQEQRDADAALDEAIRRTTAAYGHAPEGFVVTDWIVLGAGIGMRDGHDMTLGFHLMPDGGDRLNWHTTLGMVRAQQLQLEHAYLHSDDDD